MIINYVKNRWLIWCDENSCVNWGYFFFLTRFAFHHSGVGGSYVVVVFLFYRIYPQPNIMGYLSPKADWTIFSERKNGEVAFLKKQLPPLPPFQFFSSVTFGRISLQQMFSVGNFAVSGLDSLAWKVVALCQL